MTFEPIAQVLRNRTPDRNLWKNCEGFLVRAGLLRARILAKGAKARLADTLIAQTCLDHQISLVTRDKDFQIFQRLAKLELV